MTVRRIVREGVQRLQASGMGHARHEAEWLLSRLVGASPVGLYLQEPPISPRMAEQFFSQIEARACGVPLQYLLGETEFFGRRFMVKPGVFIPRPETEMVVEAALDALRERAGWLQRPLRLLDLGTGSGCIAMTLAHELPACVVVGLEVSWQALEAARQNLLTHRLSSRVWLVQGDWTAPIGGGFDGMVSNPPYVPSARIDHLPLDVRQEPRSSLDGGDDGLRDLRLVMREAPRLLKPGGVLTLECGEEQVKPLMRAAAIVGWAGCVRMIRDLALRPRGLVIERTAD